MFRAPSPAAPDSQQAQSSSLDDTGILIAAIVVPIGVVILVGVLLGVLYKRRKNRRFQDEERGNLNIKMRL
jgi:predicted histidine transporter YuiF (NhaC family)